MYSYYHNEFRNPLMRMFTSNKSVLNYNKSIRNDPESIHRNFAQLSNIFFMNTFVATLSSHYCTYAQYYVFHSYLGTFYSTGTVPALIGTLAICVYMCNTCLKYVMLHMCKLTGSDLKCSVMVSQ